MTIKTLNIETSRYEATWGKKPSGRGNWAFIRTATGQYAYAPGNISLTDAKKWLKKEINAL